MITVAHPLSLYLCETFPFVFPVAVVAIDAELAVVDVEEALALEAAALFLDLQPETAIVLTSRIKAYFFIMGV
jgi:hypothetical protein